MLERKEKRGGAPVVYKERNWDLKGGEEKIRKVKKRWQMLERKREKANRSKRGGAPVVYKERNWDLKKWRRKENKRREKVEKER